MGLIIGVSACVTVGCAIKKHREKKRKKKNEENDDDFYKPVDRESMKRRKMDEDSGSDEEVMDAATFDTINGVPITPNGIPIATNGAPNGIVYSSGSLRNRKHKPSKKEREKPKKKFLIESDDEKLDNEFIRPTKQLQVEQDPVSVKNAHNKKKHGGHKKTGSDAQNLVIEREEDAFEEVVIRSPSFKVQPKTRNSSFLDDTVETVTGCVILTNVADDAASEENFVLPSKSKDIRLSIREGDKGTVFKLYATKPNTQTLS